MRGVNYLILRIGIFVFFLLVHSPLGILVGLLIQYSEDHPWLKPVAVLPALLAAVYGLVVLPWLSIRVAEQMAFEDKTFGAALKFAIYDLRLRLAFLPIFGYWFTPAKDEMDSTMELTISAVEHAPEELYGQVPIVLDVVRKILGEDRPDYWLGKTHSPIQWIKDNEEHEVTHLVVAARWTGTRIEPGIEHLPIGIAYVIDETLLEEEKLDFSKCAYVAIGLCSETSGGKSPHPLDTTAAGSIAPAFGLGKAE